MGGGSSQFYIFCFFAPFYKAAMNKSQTQQIWRQNPPEVSLKKFFWWLSLRYQICGDQSGWKIGLQGLDFVSYSASSFFCESIFMNLSLREGQIFMQDLYSLCLKWVQLSHCVQLCNLTANMIPHLTGLMLARVCGRREAQNLQIFWPPRQISLAGALIRYKDWCQKRAIC